VALEPRDDLQGLRVVVEAAEVRHAFGQRILARVPEGRVAEIVHQGDRLGQILVQAQRARHRARDLRHLDRVGQPRAVVVSFMLDEDLGLVLEAAKGRRMKDPVTIALEGRAMRRCGLGMKPTAAPGGMRRVGGGTIRIHRETS